MTKLILACDVSDSRTGDDLITAVAPHINLVKIGFEAFTAPAQYGGTVGDLMLTRADICEKGVMLDLKIHDVANTMRAAARNIAKLGVEMFTIHATASNDALAAVAEEAGDRAIALAVTVLTDLDDSQCYSRFHASSAVAVAHFARNARKWGIRGFVCSPKEAGIIRDSVPDAYIVTPGIRPAWAVEKDEQKRVTTPAQARRAGADAIVVGRPISKPPAGYTQASAAQAIKEELAAA